MSDMEPFTFIDKAAETGKPPYHLFDDVVDRSSAKSADHDLQYLTVLRKAFPELIVTACPAYNAPLRTFAAAGFATCELDTDTDSFASWRGYVPPAKRGSPVLLGENISFAKYHYRWNNEDFILFLVGDVQYVLKEPKGDENILGPSRATDDLIRAFGDWFTSLKDLVWVYDGYWRQSYELWQEVQKASWDNVILDEDMKSDLTTVAHRFFDSEAVYKQLGVPWKRGLLFHGPPGNGKTVSIKALMHSLYNRKDPIQTLYVRQAEYTWDIGQVFSKARAEAPCLLVLEDVETIVTPRTRSYFFNEIDGLANNDGLLIVASTNFLERLDPGLTKRPSRFDRKYLFPIPNEHERTMYCEYWREKLKPNKSVVFPDKLCPAMAHITPGFSFAFLQECFVATLLELLKDGEDPESDARPFDSDNDDLNDYKLWVTFKEQADLLRGQIGDEEPDEPEILETFGNGKPHAFIEAEMGNRSRGTPRQHQGRSFPHSFGPSASINKSTKGMAMTSDLLPALSGSQQKQIFVNPAAYELRLPSGSDGWMYGKY